MAKATYLSWLGIAKEATPGTAVAPTAFISADPPTPDEKFADLVDDASRGSNVGPFAVGRGVGETEINLAGKLHADTFGWLLAAVLGDVATTGASAPYTNVMSAQNSAASGGQPTSYTLTQFTGLAATGDARTYAGCKCAELSIRGNPDGFLEWGAKFIGYPSALLDSPPSPTWEAEIPPAAYTMGLDLATVAQPTMLDFEMTLSRAVTAKHTMQNSQNPYLVWAGRLMVAGKIRFLTDDEQRILDYIANTQPALDLEFSRGAGATSQALTLHSSTIAWKPGVKLAAGDELWEIDAPFQSIADADDAGDSGGFSPILATLVNAVDGDAVYV